MWVTARAGFNWNCNISFRDGSLEIVPFSFTLKRVCESMTYFSDIHLTERCTSCYEDLNKIEEKGLSVNVSCILWNRVKQVVSTFQRPAIFSKIQLSRYFEKKFHHVKITFTYAHQPSYILGKPYHSFARCFFYVCRPKDSNSLTHLSSH